MSYNHYRHRHYNLSRNQRQHYAKEMEELQRYLIKKTFFTKKEKKVI